MLSAPLLGLTKPEGLLDENAQNDFEPIIAVLDKWKADASPEQDKVAICTLALLRLPPCLALSFPYGLVTRCAIWAGHPTAACRL